MIFRIIFAAILGVAFAQEGFTGYSESDILRTLIAEGERTLEMTFSRLMDTPKEFENIIQDRLHSLKWEAVVQKRNLNRSVTDAVFQGMFKNKQFSNFQCISNAGRDTENKLDAISNQIHENSDKVKDKELSTFMPFKVVLNGFKIYLRDLLNSKLSELKEAENETVRKKILEEAAKKVKLFNTILPQINGYLQHAKFRFFEKYIEFAFTTEKNLQNTQREGAKNILKCVS